MSDIRLNIPVGESLEVSTSGTYIAVKSANVKLDIHVDGEGKQLLSQGDAWHIDNGFNVFTVENYGAVDAVVLLAVGRGSFRAGQLVGTIDSLNTIVNPVTVNPHNINSILNPVAMKYSVLSSSAIARNTPSAALVTIVAPAANINGININGIHASADSDFFRLMAKNSAPLSYLDAAANTLAFCGYTGLSPVSSMPNKVNIPAGFGIYAQASGVVSWTTYALEYEVI